MPRGAACNSCIASRVSLRTGRAAGSRSALERFPITWNHVIEKETLKIKELEHVGIEKVEQLFRDMR